MLDSTTVEQNKMRMSNQLRSPELGEVGHTMVSNLSQAAAALSPMLDDGMQIGACPVEQTDHGRIDVPHLVSSSRAKAHQQLRRVHAETRSAPAVLPHQAVPGRGGGPDLVEPLSEYGEPGRNVTIFGRGDQVLDRPDL